MSEEIEKNVYSEENICIRYSDIDFDKSLKPFSLLNFFQDIASDNAEKLGFGYSYIFPKDLMWVLLKYRIEFYEYPFDIKQIKIRTQPRGYNKLFAYRNFEVETKGKITARASSIWSLVNFKTKTLSLIGDIINDCPYMKRFERISSDLNFEKVPHLKKVDCEKEFEVRYNDIDVNRHANNGNYIIWALEPLLYDFRIKHKLKTVDMIFKKEVKLGEKLISQTDIVDDKTTVHALKHSETEEDLCVLKCNWT